ncbi:MAG TPA: DUF4012 domain-containing protein [Patescibacteria group bacterium]
MEFEQIQKEAGAESKFKKFLKIVLVVFFIVAVLSLYGLAVFYLLNQAQDQALAGRDQLSLARQNVTDRDFGQATENFNQANSLFKKARRGVYPAYPLVIVPRVGSNVLAASRLLSAGINTTDALTIGSRIADEILTELKASKDLNYNDLTPSQKTFIISKIYNSQEDFREISDKITGAFEQVQKIDRDKVVDQISRAKEEFEIQLTGIKQTVDEVIPFTVILPQLAGYPETKTHLVLLQNSTELRPTGGFIGNYSVIKIQNGQILSLMTDNTYSLDSPMEGILQVEPPDPIKKYLEVPDWFMRDSNWSPDFKISAQKAEEFYHLEHGPEDHFDAIIGVTPELVKGFLRITGPQRVEDEVYTTDNFEDALEYRVSVTAFQLGEDFLKRKRVINTLTQQIRDDLFNLPLNHWLDIVAVMGRALEEKDLMIYEKDKDLQTVIANNNWSGELKQIEADYLMVVDANLGALKTDPFIDRTIDYSLTENDSGDYIAKVALTYNNRAGFSRTTTRYRTYTRVYAPLGSEIISQSGLMASDRSAQPGQLEVGQELNKTYFGGFISIEPGQTGQLVFEYQLPSEIKRKILSDQYQIYIQKQPGTRQTKLNVDLNFRNKIKSYQPIFEGAKRLDDNHLRFEGDLRVDREYRINF